MSSAVTTATAVLEKQILFKGPMVQAILRDLKHKTRRVIDPQPSQTRAAGHHVVKVADYFSGSPKGGKAYYWLGSGGCWNSSEPFSSPYEVGMQLWVREGLYRPDGGAWLYRADDKPVMVDPANETAMLTWAHHKQQNYCPSMFMPRWASRITLEVTDVCAERLHDITQAEARQEGISVLPLQSADDPTAWWQSSPGVHQDRTARGSFIQLWDSINEKRGIGWDVNPWVWVIGFEQVQP